MLQMKTELMIIWKGYTVGFVGLWEVCIWIVLRKKNESNTTKSETRIFNFPIWDAIQSFWGACLFRKLAFVLNQNK